MAEPRSDGADVDWSALRCAGGSAAPDVPVRLGRLTDPNARKRAAARRDLAGLFKTYDGRLPHTGALAVVRALTRLLETTPYPEDRGGLLETIAAVAVGDLQAHALTGLDPRHSNLAWLLQSSQPLTAVEHDELHRQRAVRDAVVETTPWIVAGLADADPRLRSSAAYAAMFVPERREVLVEALARALAEEASPIPAASMLITLAQLRASSIPAIGLGKAPVPLAATLARALARLDDADEARLLELAHAEVDTRTLTGLAWFGGQLGVAVGPTLVHASYERGDLERHAALVERLPSRLVTAGRGLQLLLELGRGRRHYRRAAAHELDADQRAALARLLGEHEQDVRWVLDAAGLFQDAREREPQLAGVDPLARRHQGEPLWRLLSDATDEVVTVDAWLAGVRVSCRADPAAMTEVVLAAADGAYQLYRRGARDGIPAGGARWDTFDAILTRTVDALGLAPALADYAARYVIADGLNRGLFLLTLARARAVDPKLVWVQRVRAEIETRWVREPRVDALKAWADG